MYRDMSLGEIAQERGISRQGVHDLIKRCDRILQEYESKLHLVERFTKAKKTVAEIERLTLSAQYSEKADEEADERADATQAQGECLRAIRKLAQELLEEL